MFMTKPVKGAKTKPKNCAIPKTREYASTISENMHEINIKFSVYNNSIK